jgi:hypothetical protein
MGLVGLTNVLAIEGQKHNINVNAICPIAKTRMTEEPLGPLGEQLDPALVSPLVAWLVHEDCPTTGEIFSAGGGCISRFFVGLTPGYYDTGLTAESIRDNWDTVRNEEGYTVPFSIQDELGKLLGLFSS